MTRKEMVQNIIDAVYACSFSDAHLTEGEADSILEELLKYGMKPPRLDSERCQVLMQVYIDPDFNMWDEDFEKDEKAMEKWLKPRLKQRTNPRGR